MNNCLNCGKEVKQTPGKKERKYCDDKCKQRHWQKMKAEKRGNVTISREEYDSLLKGNYCIPETSESERITVSLAPPEKLLKQLDVDEYLDKESLGEKPYKPESKKLSYFEERQQAKLK
jgi:endogenous inhibitor of DNA gyrase (YacG/DUF329 family)